MQNFWQTLPRPILVLAPMAGYTDSPFRRLVREIEPSTILVSELISAEALRRKNARTLEMCAFAPDEKNFFGIQLFGSSSEAFSEAAKVVQDLGADFIDLNFGCPSPKVVNSGHGSALLKNPESSARMIEKLVKSTPLPVSVKMRLGFFSDENLVSTAKNFESAGISSLAIHGRTTKQKFTGNADWQKIYEVKENLSIPVIGNGDISSAALAFSRLQNLDGVMIGRAAMRNPWIFRQCREIFSGQAVSSKPDLAAQLKFFEKNAEMAAEFKDEKWAVIQLRKHFSTFCRGFKNAAGFREKLIRVSSISEMKQIFAEILEQN